MVYPGKEDIMTFSQMLEKGLKDSWQLRNDYDNRKYQILEYIQWSYHNASDKHEFARCLWSDVATLVNTA